MAKSTTSSKRKVAVFSIKGWDAAHYKTTNQYANAVQRIMVATTNDISRMVAGKTIDTDKPFSFADYPAIQREVDKAVADMANTMTMTIEKGSRKEWLSATRKGDAFLDSIMTTSKVSKKRLQTMQDKNLDALSAFQSRKVDGMNLSQRVWKYAGQFKDQIEQCIDVGLGEGRSADELSRDVRQNLKDPNRLFRRVRDKRGNLVLSKNARAFHPGQGVYRSSYKNAMRLTRSEINMAYRESDYLRWQQLDFVIGIEIHRSNHEPLCECKMCERLQGKYPKTFKFKGWHPQCMCYATPILVTDDEFDAQELSDLKSALHGTEYKKLAVKGEITDVPDGFKSWVDDNKDASKNWKSVPYFVKDNFVDGELAKGLKPAAMQSKAVKGTPDEPVNRVPYDQLDKEAQRHWRNFLYDHYPVDYDWEQACQLYGVSGIDEYVQHIDSAYDNDEYWRESELIAEQARIDAALKTEIERCHEQAKQGIADYVAVAKESFKWIGIGDEPYIQYAYDYMSKEASEKYPNYKSVINALNGGSYDVPRLKLRMQGAENAYNAAVAEAKTAITKLTGNVDVSKLTTLINEPISPSRPAVVITKEIKAEILRLESMSPLAIDGIRKSKDHNELRERMVNGGFATDVDLAKMDFNSAKEVCATIATYVQVWKIKPIRIACCGFGRGNGSAFAHANATKVEYNTKYFDKKNKLVLQSSFDECVTDYVKNAQDNIARWTKSCQDYENAIQKCMDDLAKQSNMSPSTIKYYKDKIKDYRKWQKQLDGYIKENEEKLKAGVTRHNVFFSYETMAKNIAQHELGHTVQDQWCGGINWTLRNGKLDVATAQKYNSEILSLYTKHKKTCGKWLSDYGRYKNDQEFFAESMVIYMEKGGKGLPSDVKDLFDRLLKDIRSAK